MKTFDKVVLSISITFFVGLIIYFIYLLSYSDYVYLGHQLLLLGIGIILIVMGISRLVGIILCVAAPLLIYWFAGGGSYKWVYFMPMLLFGLGIMLIVTGIRTLHKYRNLHYDIQEIKTIDSESDEEFIANVLRKKTEGKKLKAFKLVAELVAVLAIVTGILSFLNLSVFYH